MTAFRDFVVLALIVACGHTASAAKAPSLCAQAEHVIFSCSTRGKIVSVCASADLSSKAGELDYRFGPAGKPEITYPPAGGWRGVTTSGVWTFSGGGGAWLAFRRDQVRYIVYTAIGRGWGTKDGVAVEKNGRLLTNVPCLDNPVSKLGPDFFTSAGIPDDKVPFDVP